MTPSPRRERLQYHHYIPRFILRKWEVPPPDSDIAEENRDEKYIYMYNVRTGALKVGPHSKAYSIVDMYKNDSDLDDPYHIEKLFCELETRAAAVLSKLDKMAGPQPILSLPRYDVNTLRKFLFLLNYRNSRHFHQYLKGRFDEGTEIEVETFRQKHNLGDTFAVWLFNLRNILESEHWKIPTNENILKSVRDLYRAQSDTMQLAFYICSCDSEFVLTDNGLGLSYQNSSALSPGANPASCSWRHTLTFPVSPRLLIQLRPTTSAQQALMDIGIFYEGSRVDDTLTFHADTLTAEQSARMNALRLENDPDVLTFTSREKLLSSIRFYDNTEGVVATGGPLNSTACERVSYAPLTRRLQHLLVGNTPPTSSAVPSYVTSQGISPTERPDTRPASASNSGGLGPTAQHHSPDSGYFSNSSSCEEDDDSTTQDIPELEHAPNPDPSNYNSESSTSSLISFALAIGAMAWWGYKRYCRL